MTPAKPARDVCGARGAAGAPRSCMGSAARRGPPTEYLIGLRRSAFAALGARCSACSVLGVRGAPRSAFGVRRSAFGARRSALGVRRSALGVRRSALGVRRSALGVRRSAFAARHSFSPRVRNDRERAIPVDAFLSRPRERSACRRETGPSRAAFATWRVFANMTTSKGVCALGSVASGDCGASKPSW
jgi:hypothetical protein